MVSGEEKTVSCGEEMGMCQREGEERWGEDGEGQREEERVSKRRDFQMF